MHPVLFGPVISLLGGMHRHWQSQPLQETRSDRGMLHLRARDFLCHLAAAMQVRETLGLASETDGHQAEGAFVMLVGPRATGGLALALQSLAVNVLAFHPRPVLLFYGAGAQRSADCSYVIRAL